MNPEFIPLIAILIITTVITCLIKFYNVIWNIYTNTKNQNELIEEQNKLLKELVDLYKFRTPQN